MLSDEEKNSMELDIEAKYVGRTEKEFLNNITYAECLYILDTKNKYCDDIRNLSLLKIVDIVNEQSKEMEELKEERKSYAEEYIHNNPWLYKQLNEVYMLRTEAEQKERKAYIKGTNDADELCNKKWEDKIKAKIEPKLKELDEQMKKEWKEYGNSREYQDMEDEWNFLQSLLEKE